MKTLKLKSILFSLMALAMVTVFLSSCEKNSEFDELPQNEVNQVNGIEELDNTTEEIYYLELPENMSNEDINEWASNLSYEEVQSISIKDNSGIKNDSEVEGDIESRGCGSWFTVYLENKYLGCQCSGNGARYKVTYYKQRNCVINGVNQTFAKPLVIKYVCYSFC